jgi:hypothetical protein
MKIYLPNDALSYKKVLVGDHNTSAFFMQGIFTQNSPVRPTATGIVIACVNFETNYYNLTMVWPLQVIYGKRSLVTRPDLQS